MSSKREMVLTVLALQVCFVALGVVAWLVF